ncbi:lysophospholipid acyltransferase family protein [Cellulomonas marina]|uniref:1-acyl-sn-glycerol-3-phosphate acyltransferases n=1 Tax=Cellulomonas marina TaxID=988821 RepID=A0A1I0YRA4_9CELL|nr:lysophospholipid acyltransferase family protein [Cellulomonas marina]GIG27614.1 1-acyl-sn-glycerol-3-phosphate acyltransferase [Cellulomonas marina]SFB14838.1 1-acyl-sn-glycerol-3-phosphate acyltransferases [Cellulomonas marina]
MPSPTRSTPAYRAVARVVRPAMRAMTRTDWRGAEHLPASGGFIAAANHVTNIDPLTFAHYLWDHGYAPKILAKASLFDVPVLGGVLRATGQIPVARGTAAAGDSLAAAERAVAAGDCVAVFPEGTLTRDPDLWPMLAKTGVARLALATGAPVVPVAQWGAQELLGWYSKRLRPVPRKLVTVVAGPPVDLADLEGRPADTAALREATARIMRAITVQLEGIRGATAPAEPFDMRRRGAAGAGTDAGTGPGA